MATLKDTRAAHPGTPWIYLGRRVVVGVGIGANTSIFIFSVVNAWLRALPYKGCPKDANRPVILGVLLFGITTTDAFTFTVIALVLILIALLASYIPARRAVWLIL